jgi:hypothetical protein
MHSPYSCNLKLYWVGKIPACVAVIDCLKSSYITDRIRLPYNFIIHTKQWSHPEDGSSMYFWNVETSTHCTVQKP